MKVIRLSGTQNTRYVTNGIIRSDKLDKLSKNDKEILLSLGVNTVIDLRREKNRNSSIVEDERFDYHYCTLEVEKWDKIKRRFSEKSEDDILVEQYLGYLLQYRVINNIFNTVVEAIGKSVIMCHYGKGRTGVIAALIGLLADKCYTDIINDYSISSQNINDEADNSKFAHLKSNEIIMRQFINSFHDKYGNIEEYLKTVGFKPGEIKELKQKIVG